MDRENKKIVADNLFKISISSLKLKDFLKGGVTGTVDVPYNSKDLKDGIHLVISLSESDPYVYFYYSVLQPDGSYGPIEYRVDLEATRCNYGGLRYWFRCPLEILGCGRRIRVLYKVGDYLGCRNCYDLTYESRNLSGIRKKFGIVNMPQLHSEGSNFKRLRYKGKPTKKLIRFNKKFVKAMAMLNMFREQCASKSKQYHKKYKFVEGMTINISGLTALNIPAGYATNKLGNFILNISNIIDGLNKNENANISGLLDNGPSTYRPFLTINVPNSYFHDPGGIVSFDSGDSTDFKFWYMSKPDNKSAVILKTRFDFTGIGSGFIAKDITCFDEFARSLGFENENKLFECEPGIFGGYAQVYDDSGKLDWTKAI